MLRKAPQRQLPLKPVKTASTSLTRRIAWEKVGVGFDHLGEFSEIIDPVGRGRYLTWLLTLMACGCAESSGGSPCSPLPNGRNRCYKKSREVVPDRRFHQ